ncbi:MAG: IS21-like element helper ATPase IstB [Proteobacteria bacterium]|nr:IS21-like element helper ATPase IstB [Pseudomonadota bacterium]MBS0598882.1 IS21-like element helper ATPase IstB [Pseudomonadota bacterium]
MHNHLLDKLHGLRLNGMAEALSQQATDGVFAGLAFEPRLQMLVEAEIAHRDNHRYQRILKNARLKVVASPEDIDYRPGRGLDKTVVADLLTCTWIEKHRNVLITGATGTGKTWLACAFGVQAARRGLTVAYRRTARMLEEMAVGHEDGTIAKQRSQLAKAQLLILDDFGLTPLTARGRTDLLEVLDDRSDSGATILLGQMPVKEWHGFINDPALADAILDRLVHSSVKIDLKGESLRRQKTRGGQ